MSSKSVDGILTSKTVDGGQAISNIIVNEINNSTVNLDTDQDIKTSAGVICNTLRVVSAAQNGYVLTSDALGNATWQLPGSSNSNLYNNDGTLQGNRQVNCNNLNLSFLNSSTYSIQANTLNLNLPSNLVSRYLRCITPSGEARWATIAYSELSGTPSANQLIDHSTISILTGSGLVGGGNLTTSRTLSLSPSGVSAGTYGSSSTIPQITVDTLGRITSANNISLPAITNIYNSNGTLTSNRSLTLDGKEFTILSNNPAPNTPIMSIDSGGFTTFKDLTVSESTLFIGPVIFDQQPQFNAGINFITGQISTGQMTYNLASSIFQVAGLQNTSLNGTIDFQSAAFNIRIPSATTGRVLQCVNGTTGQTGWVDNIALAGTATALRLTASSLGVAATPSISIGTNGGLFSPSANSISIAAGGVAQANFTSTTTTLTNGTLNLFGSTSTVISTDALRLNLLSNTVNSYLRCTNTNGACSWSVFPDVSVSSPLSKTGTLIGANLSLGLDPAANISTTGTITSTQHIAPSNGTAAEPAFKVGTSGMYQSAAGTLNLTAGGIDVMTCSTSANILSNQIITVNGSLLTTISGGLGVTLSSTSAVTIDIPSKIAGGVLKSSDANGRLVFEDPIYYSAGWTNNATASNVITAGSFVKADIALTVDSASKTTNWTTTGNRINWTGPSRVACLHFSCTIQGPGANNNYSIFIFKNNIPIGGTLERQTSGAIANSFLNMCTQSLVTLNNNDFFELFVTNGTTTVSDPIVVEASFIFIGC